MNVNQEIKRFLEVAAAAWRPLFDGYETGGEEDDLACDWLQFHWELLVEQSLCSRGHNLALETYGDGAETGDGRIFPAVGPLFRVFCTAKDSNRIREMFSGATIESMNESFPVEHFASGGKGFFTHEPPFNCVLIYQSHDGDPLCLDIADLDFFVREIPEHLGEGGGWTDLSGKVRAAWDRANKVWGSHWHKFDADGNPLDDAGRRVGTSDPAAHIPDGTRL